MFTLTNFILAIAAFVAGVQNALAGGGSFLTFPALLMAGLDPRAANVTSSVALFPGQIASGLAGRRNVRALPAMRLRTLFAINVIGGGLGALLLLGTPTSIFSALVPWLVLFATLVFAWGSFFRKPDDSRGHLSPTAAGITQFVISVYGGYFGGGIGILLMAALSLSGLSVRHAGATKNAMAGVINSAAVLLFAFSHDVAWAKAAVVGVAALAGGQLGVYALTRVNERILRVCIVALGVALTVGLFWRYHSG